MAKGDLYQLRFRSVYTTCSTPRKSIALMRGTILLDTGMEEVGNDSRGFRYIHMYSLSEKMVVLVHDYEIPMDMNKLDEDSG